MEDDDSLSPHDRLKPLAWLVGDWVDEGSDAVVQIACKWSDDTNYLLVDFNAKIQGKPALKSSQRIGWDPLTQKVKSWVFDSDGGHGEGLWSQVENRWVIKSTAVMPDGQTGLRDDRAGTAGQGLLSHEGLRSDSGQDGRAGFRS